MSCKFPLKGEIVGFNEETGRNRIIVSSIDQSKDLDENGDLLKKYIRIPCGKCASCRIDKSREWADRMMLELAENDGKAIFLTLTYNDNNLDFTEIEDWAYYGYLPRYPYERYDDVGNLYIGAKPTLNVRDTQLFLKRLRKEFDDKTIRFYLAGEYGPKSQRPHYHLIVFGLTLDDFPDRKEHGRNELGQIYYKSRKLQDIWKKGFCLFSEVSWKTCAYVARYCQKKLYGDLGDTVYESRKPPFSTMSRRPGIAGTYLGARNDIFDMAKLYVPGAEVNLPKYFLRILRLRYPAWYDKIMAERKEFASDVSFLRLDQTECDLVEQGYIENEKLERSITALRRDRVDSDLK